MDSKQFIKTLANKIVRQSKVAMLHTGRCGSTVVGSLLNQHPNFYWSGEPFEKLMGSGPLSDSRIRDVIKEREQDRISKIYSFATKYPDGMHLSDACIGKTIPEYIHFLTELDYKKFILITRKNHLKRVISILNGRKTGEWHTQKSKVTASTVEVPINNFDWGNEQVGSLTDYFDIMDREILIIKDCIGGKPLLHLEYESDIEEEPLKAYRKICEFTEIGPNNPVVKLKKTNPFIIKDLISNYEDVKAYLQYTPYAWMIHE